MNLALTIAQLKQHCPALANRVGGAAEHELAAEQGYLTVPAAYIIPLADDAEDNIDQSQLQQLVTETIGVVLVLDNTTDRRGQTSSINVEAMKYAVHKALLNWNPNPARAMKGMQYAGGSLLKVDGARLIWQLVYAHQVLITEQDGFEPDGEPLVGIDGYLPDGTHILAANPPQ